MIPRSFDYHVPTTPAEAVGLVAADPQGTQVLGGGTWLVPDLNRGLAASAVVDLARAGLGAVERSNGTVRVGAMTTYATLLASAVIRDHLPLLEVMAAGITGGRQITTQATVGGSAAAARPASDVPAAITALGAEAVVLGPEGERRVPAEEFFLGSMQNALAPGEILTGWEAPSARGLGRGYVKLKRSGSSWPIVTAGALVGIDGDGRCSTIRLALGGVAHRPMLVDLDERLVGERPSDAAIDGATADVGRTVAEPWADVLAPADYRRAVAAPIARRALRMAIENVDGTSTGAA